LKNEKHYRTYFAAYIRKSNETSDKSTATGLPKAIMKFLCDAKLVGVIVAALKADKSSANDLGGRGFS
jgi:hypothetical protein